MHQPRRVQVGRCHQQAVEHQTRFAGRAIQQTYHVDFFSQQGDQVAECDSWCFRTERDPAREQGSKYKDLRAREPRRYSPEEIQAAYQLYRDEQVRGATPRYWQDVTEGDTALSLLVPHAANLIGGQVPVGIDTVSASRAFIASGQLKALAATSLNPKRGRSCWIKAE